MKMSSLIITWSGFQDHELCYSYYRLKEEGNVLVMAEMVGKIKGILGIEMEASLSFSDLDPERDLDTFDLLVLPGGVKAMEKLRQNTFAIDFIRSWNAQNKLIASVCSGAQMLISANVLKGRRIAAYPAMKIDVINAGAEFVDQPVVIDGNIISSPHYKWMGEWMKEVIIRWRAL